VATYWTEFAQNGKENITIRQLLSNQAGLCVIDEPLDARVLAGPDAVASILARQGPAWEPGTRHGYHYLSLGLYEGELIRRTDSQRRSLERFFQDAHFGLLWTSTLDVMLLFMPDVSWIALVCGSFALAWMVLRTGLVLWTLRKRSVA
jgi:Beta-lactamase